MSVDVHDGDRFEQGDEDQTRCAGERIEDFHPVFTGARYEHEADQETDQAHHACNNKCEEEIQKPN